MTDSIQEAAEALEQARAERDKLPQGEARQAMNRALDRVEVAISKAREAAQGAEDTAEDLYDRLHSLSKSLEGSGRLDEHDNPDAYATVLDAMNYVRRGTVAS